MMLEIIEARIADKSALQNMLQLYLHDLSAFEKIDVDSNGRFEYQHLDVYWQE